LAHVLVRCQSLAIVILHKYLAYDPKTGVFTWKLGRGTRGKVGTRAGTLSKFGYRYITLFGERYTESHIAFFFMKGRWPEEVDHKNRISYDNKWRNLREATRFQNNLNRTSKRPKNPGLPRGVRFKDNRYEASCTLRGKWHYLGRYDNSDEAHNVYCQFLAEKLGKDKKYMAEE
jgi:hypothetical protein